MNSWLAILNVVLIAVPLAPAIYYAISAASLDPHNPWALQRSKGIYFKTSAALFAFIVAPGLSSVNPDWATFWGSLFLGQVISPAFTSGDRYRIDEESDRAERMWLYWKSAIGGIILLKILCIVLYFTLQRFIGIWWFVIVLALAFYSVLGRIFTAHLLAPTLNANGPLNGQSRWLRVTTRRGTVGFLVCCVCAAFIFMSVELPSFSWWSWSGLILGGLINALRER